MRRALAAATALAALASLVGAAPDGAAAQRSATRALVSGRLGTKTAYDDRLPPAQALDPADCPAAGRCRAEHVFHVVRHGTRFPTAKHLAKLNRLTDWFGPEWPVPFDPEDAGLLASRGKQELEEMGRRMRERFPEIFQDFNPQSHDIWSSEVTRAMQSATAYVAGLFPDMLPSEDVGEQRDGDVSATDSTGGDCHGDANVCLDDSVSVRHVHGSIPVKSTPKEADTRLRFHKACPAYQVGVKKNATHRREGPAAMLEERLRPELFQLLVEQVRTHPRGGDQIADALVAAEAQEAITLVWELCALELAVHERVSPYCELLSAKAVEELEFLEDVATYWVKGYGFSINYEMSCLLFEDLVGATVRAAARVAAGHSELADPPLRGTFRFAHAETLLPLIARLGLFHDENGKEMLRADADPASPEVAARHWRAGSIAPFGANIAVVLWSCPGKEMAVQVLHNELPVPPPRTLCHKPGVAGDLTLCPLADFESTVADLLGCDFHDLCSL